MKNNLVFETISVLGLIESWPSKGTFQISKVDQDPTNMTIVLWSDKFIWYFL